MCGIRRYRLFDARQQTSSHWLFFDIEDDKAPGPDGFSAKFFKVAWPVVGDEICLAVKDFFRNGLLLKEINSTIISLVPKISNPVCVTDYRPIACCNVIYKGISKILCNRIRDDLCQIVDEKQSAFIPGRQIGDNVLLSQELLMDYHRNRGTSRAALKIDIQKAYDTVDLGFLKECLFHFGFHPIMTNWLITCVTTASFSININGIPYGFFKGVIGLKQGDPLSPYLFTLVMEVLNLILKRTIRGEGGFQYHWRCQEMELTHLCFADDLLMFCNPDVGSFGIIKKALKEFSDVSGLVPNMSKSTLFFGNVGPCKQAELFNLLPFKVGSLPVRYLGVPLLSSRLYSKDCIVLIERVMKRVSDWKNKSLSFAGRLQLINSVLASLQVYWASVFILPINVIEDI